MKGHAETIIKGAAWERGSEATGVGRAGKDLGVGHVELARAGETTGPCK